MTVCILHTHMQKSIEQKDVFMLTSEVARELERSAQRVIQLERDGKLPAQRTAGGTRLFRRSDVERFKRELEAKRA